MCIVQTTLKQCTTRIHSVTDIEHNSWILQHLPAVVVRLCCKDRSCTRLIYDSHIFIRLLHHHIPVLIFSKNTGCERIPSDPTENHHQTLHVSVVFSSLFCITAPYPWNMPTLNQVLLFPADKPTIHYCTWCSSTKWSRADVRKRKSWFVHQALGKPMQMTCNLQYQPDVPVYYIYCMLGYCMFQCHL